MCGIVGYTGMRSALEVVMAGLHRLEYRGYDSAGVAILGDGTLRCVKTRGKLARLDERTAREPLPGTLGIGHTRWATHGAPNERNSHPHLDEPGDIAVVHNGIIENYEELRDRLRAGGVAFRSETDSETLAHLIRFHYKGDLMKAVQEALHEVTGAYAIAVVSRHHPGLLVAARQGSPLVVGVGAGEGFVASDVSAVMRYTREVVYLDNGQVCAVEPSGARVETVEGDPVPLSVQRIDWDDAAAEKEGYPHFMLKEIHQQPEVLRNTLRGRLEEGSDRVRLADMNLNEEDLRQCGRIHIVACGTAWHAGILGKYLIEEFAQVPVEVDIASEYRYRDPLIPPHTLMLAISQSGETADTLEAIRIAKRKGAQVAAVVNTVGSSVAREAHGVVYQQAGPEIGVASTKAYTSQLMCLSLFAIWLGETRGVLSREKAHFLLDELRALPDKVKRILDTQDATLRRCAQDPRYRDVENYLYLGRSYNFASALEGALKLKEISYIHAEGCASGEMKHGPIALITETWPVVSVAVKGRTYEKAMSNVQEIRARGGICLNIGTEGDTAIAGHSTDVVYVPECHEPFSPILVAVPLQLLAYHISAARGCDVDQPRNLAKSVTVE
jgi:glutamine---fructose-6-phosphate transaminase (isomerizing)